MMVNEMHIRARQTSTAAMLEGCATAERRFYRGSEAPQFYPDDYDDEASRRPKKAAPPKSANAKQKDSKSWLMVTVMAVLAAICGIMIVIHAERIAEAKTRATALGDEYEALEQEYFEKMTAYESMLDMDYISETARDKLGMGNPRPDQLLPSAAASGEKPEAVEDENPSESYGDPGAERNDSGIIIEEEVPLESANAGHSSENQYYRSLLASSASREIEVLPTP